MELVAIARAPARPDDAARAVAQAAGLTLAEARMRLAPEPPALLARLESAEAGALVGGLRRLGLAALSVDARVPHGQGALHRTLVLPGRHRGDLHLEGR